MSPYGYEETLERLSVGVRSPLESRPSAPTQSDGSGLGEASCGSASRWSESPVCVSALVTVQFSRSAINVWFPRQSGRWR